MNTPLRNNVRHTNGFDILRLIAASAVIFGHAYPLTGNAAIPIFLGSSISTIAVKIFFVISGFLIAKSWLVQPNLLTYYKKRCLRIFPGLIVVTLLSALVLGPSITSISLYDYFANSGLRIFIINNIMLFPIYNLPAVFADNIYPIAVNGSLWSLPIEFFMYMLVPVILCIKSYHKPFVIIFAILGTVLYVHSQYSEIYKFVVYGSFVQSALEVMPFFCLGMVWCLFALERFKTPIFSCILLAVCGVLLGNSFLGSVALLLLLPQFVVSIGTTNFSLLDKIIHGRDYSYGVYLYGFPIQQLLVHLTNNSIATLYNALFAWIISLGLAALSFHFVEKPALRLKNITLKKTRYV